MEATEDLDLLDQLAIADVGPLAPGPLDVAFLGEVGHRLADRRQADAQCLGELALPGQLRARRQPALLDALEHRDLDLVVQRHRAVPPDRRGQS
jgi:hypothetical protein